MKSRDNKTNPSVHIPRRSFLKGALTASAFSTFSIIGSRARAEEPKAEKTTPNEKVNLACCGIGAQGGTDINALYSTGLCNIVALCDTDMGGPHTLDMLKKFLPLNTAVIYKISLQRNPKT